MRSRRQRRKFFAAWLGLIGLAVQALLPMLLAVEIAAQPFDPASEALCLHTPADAPPTQPQREHFTGCAICLSLAASVAFTAPTPLTLPLPARVSIDVFARIEIDPRAPAVVASYRSRAPPQLG